MWKKFFVGIGLAVMTMGFVVPPVFAQSVSNECTCFCGTEAGAKKVSETKMKPEACTEACQDKKQKVAVCATSLAQYPANNSSCFPLDVCNAEGGKFSDPYVQPSECPETWGYCFRQAEAAQLQLNVPIGAVKSVKDLGVYMSVVYKWMLGAAILFSTVMIMIGGLQWSLGAVSSSQIQKAKDRIKNGIIGLILLFAVVLIAQTVNPELLTLKPPRISMIKEKNSPDIKTCEEYNAELYELDVKSGVCGDSAEIIGAPDGKAFIDGIACNYTGCDAGLIAGTFIPSSSNKCVLTPTGGRCEWCGNILPTDKFNLGVKPSSQMCRSLSISGDDWLIPNTKIVRKCFYSHDPDLIFTAGVVGAAVDLNAPGNAVKIATGVCAELNFDCAEYSKCEDYDNRKAKNNLTSQELDDLYNDGPLSGEVTLADICFADPCEYNGTKGCWFDGVADCKTPD